MVPSSPYPNIVASSEPKKILGFKISTTVTLHHRPRDVCSIQHIIRQCARRSDTSGYCQLLISRITGDLKWSFMCPVTAFIRSWTYWSASHRIRGPCLFLPCRPALNVTLLVSFSCRLCARLWRERDKRPTMKRTIVLSANPRPNVFKSHGFENSSCTRGLLRGLQADATFRHCAASGRERCTHIHTGASRSAAARNFIVKHTPSSSIGPIYGRAARSQRRRRAHGPVYD